MRSQTGILLSLFVRLVTRFTPADAGIFLQLPVLGEVSELRPEGVFSSGTATCSENGVNREVSLRVDEGVLRGLHDAKPVVPAGTHSLCLLNGSVLGDRKLEIIGVEGGRRSDLRT